MTAYHVLACISVSDAKIAVKFHIVYCCFDQLSLYIHEQYLSADDSIVKIWLVAVTTLYRVDNNESA